MFPKHVQDVIDDMLPTIRALAQGDYAISIGGSYGRKQFDQYSDLDFRLYCQTIPPQAERQQLTDSIQRWGEQGVTIDGCWIRTVADISRQLDQWCAGEGVPQALVWTVWGYYLPCDIYNQHVIEDPFDIIANWKAQLQPYPPLLKQAVLDQHLRFIRYWREDYHYRHKVLRQDMVFLAGLTSKIVHSLIQILFALNETYYVGDGNNLTYLRRFTRLPENVVAEIEAVLYPPPSADVLDDQYRRLMRLIDMLETFMAQTE
ncbi:MAG: hypothetical protein CL610_28400 [Anaerolineaceae bacterium]|nr:hypothetical protein [Anaerolineaceae bacterium]